MAENSELSASEILEFRGNLASYVIPILFGDDRESTVGSSVPLHIGKHLYLLSAEHVFKKGDGSARYSVLIPSNDKWKVGNITELANGW